MQGTPYIYQGEEIGMTNPNFRELSQYRDVESLNAFEILQNRGVNSSLALQILAQKSRDNSRTPVQWDSSPNAGFSQGTPWIEVAENYREINVEQALSDRNSVFYTYQALIKLRKTLAVLTDGDYQDLLPAHSHIWAYQRQTSNERLTVLANLSGERQQLPFEVSGRVIMNNDSKFDGSTLQPYQAVYLLAD